jgi:hypothetical protein
MSATPFNAGQPHRDGQELRVRAVAELPVALRGGDVPHAALTDLVPCVVWTARPDGLVDYANRFWLHFTGLTLAQTYGWG